MQRADTVTAQMAGLHIEKHLSSADSKEARAVAERRRVLEWRVADRERAADGPVALAEECHGARAHREMRAEAREEDVDIAILAQA